MNDNAAATAPVIVDVTDSYRLDPVAEGIDFAYGELEPAGSDTVRRGERGMVTAEYAIGIIAAVSLAGILLMIIVKGPLKPLLEKVIVHIINQVSAMGLK